MEVNRRVTIYIQKRNWEAWCRLKAEFEGSNFVNTNLDKLREQEEVEAATAAAEQSSQV